jgi:LysR family glycine cleavage system transcriptional activator
MRVFAVCAPSVAAALTTPADLAGVRLLHESHVPSAWASFLEAAGVAELRPAGQKSFDNAQLMLDAAVAGQGVALSTDVLAHRLLGEGRLVRPFALEMPTPLAYHWVCRRGDEKRAAVAAFRDWLFREMREFCGA